MIKITEKNHTETQGGAMTPEVDIIKTTEVLGSEVIKP